jgi:hypothetical protein
MQLIVRGLCMRLPHTVLSQSGREVDSAWASSRRPDAEPTVDAVQHGATFMLDTPQPSAEVTATQACVHGTLVRDSAGLMGAGRHQRVKQVGCHRSGSPNPGGIDLSSARPAETTRLEATFRAGRARPIASKPPRPGRLRPGGRGNRGAVGRGEARALGHAREHGHDQLNANKPVILHNVLESIRLLRREHRVERKADTRHLDNSLMLMTPNNPHIGYEKAAQISPKAYRKNPTLREAELYLAS